MKSYKLITDKIEIRSSIDGKIPEYIVRGYASIPNELDWAKFNKIKNGDGTYKFMSVRTMFTDNAVNSMNRQAKAKKVFVDAEHTTAFELNAKTIINNLKNEAKQKGVNLETPFEKVLDYIKHSELPFAKVDKLDIDDKGLIIDTQLNPSFRELSKDHEKYFDAVWGSLKNGFINGISINFTPTKVIQKNINGNLIDVIDDVDLYGFSYTGQPALPENSITEVFTRSAIEFKEEMDKMEKIEVRETQTIDVESIKTQTRLELQKEFDNKLKLEKEKFEQQQYIESLKRELEQKKKEVEDVKATRKGIVSSQESSETINPERFKESVSKLSLGECIGDPILAQAAFDSLSAETKQFGRKSSSDIVVKRDFSKAR